MALTHTRPFSLDALSESAWYWAIQPAVQALGVCTEFPSREKLTDLHAQCARAADVPPLAFAPHVKRTRRQRGTPIDIDALYDGLITTRHQVPTRDADWHDLFNALVFASFPRSKRALHARQYAQLKLRVGQGATKLPGARSREQDTLTLFDEGGSFVAGGRAALQPLRALEQTDTAHERELFCDALRAGVQARELVVAPFGHALFEHKAARLRGPSSFAYLLELPELTLERAALVTALDQAFTRVLCDPARFCSPTELRRLDLSDLGEPLAHF